MSEQKQYEFYAGMTCDGCSGAITRIIKRIDSNAIIQCNVDTKQVLVTTTADKDLILKKLLKWGKASQKKYDLLDR